MLPEAAERPLELADVDREFARRLSFWRWLPDEEREEFAAATAAGDAEAVRRLTKRGERRGRFHVWERCHFLTEVRRADGSKVLGEDGEPMVIALHGADEDCQCMVRALDSDMLVAYATRDGRDAPRVAGKPTLSYVAAQLHRDPDWSIEDYIAAKETEARKREEAKAETLARERLMVSVEPESEADPLAPVPEPVTRTLPPSAAKPRPPTPSEQPKGRPGYRWESQRSRREFDFLNHPP